MYKFQPVIGMFLLFLLLLSLLVLFLYGQMKTIILSCTAVSLSGKFPNTFCYDCIIKLLYLHNLHITPVRNDIQITAGMYFTGCKMFWCTSIIQHKVIISDTIFSSLLVKGNTCSIERQCQINLIKCCNDFYHLYSYIPRQLEKFHLLPNSSATHF